MRLLCLGKTLGNLKMSVTEFVRWFITGEREALPDRLLRGAQRGDSDDQMQLGVCFYTGRGVPQDNERAVHWFNQSAMQGNAKAQFYLGRARLSGEGGPREQESAYAWFDLAAANGYKKAKEWRGVAGRQMTPDQIEEAQQLSRELTERICGLQCRMKIRKP